MWNESIIIELLASHFTPYKASISNRFLTESDVNAVDKYNGMRKKNSRTHTFFHNMAAKRTIFELFSAKCPANSVFSLLYSPSFALVRLLKRQNESITDNTVVVTAYWRISTREHTAIKLLFPVFTFTKMCALIRLLVLFSLLILTCVRFHFAWHWCDLFQSAKQ